MSSAGCLIKFENKQTGIEGTTNFDPHALHALKAVLLEKMDAGCSVRISAADVIEPSTAFIQVIEVAAADFSSRGLSCSLADPSDALCQCYADLGLYSALMARIGSAG